LRLPFSSPPTTRRVTVEVFDPAYTRGTVDLSLLLSIYNFGLTGYETPRSTVAVSMG
jgi:hypothetical protein